MVTLVPWPRDIEFLDGRLTIGKGLRFDPPADGDDACRALADTCRADFAEFGFGGADDATPVALRIADDDGLGPEGYRLDVDDAIAVTASTATGLFYGTRTLLQLLAAGPGSDVPRLRIADAPDFAYRGLMIDNARAFHSIDFHIRTIRRIASYKMNRYHVHWSDGQSYTLPSAAFPALPTEGRCHTRDEIRALVETAEAYHVTIVPEIDVPGHAAALVRAIPAVRCTHHDEAAGTVCLGSDAARDALRRLFAEIMEMIPGTEWHLGADEVHYAAYDSCAACAARLAKLELPDIHGLYREFINDMHAFVRGRGRRMFVWEGFDPTATPVIDKDIIVCPFDVKHPGKLPGDYLDAGYTLLNTAWTPLYVADHYCMSTPEDIARWTPYAFGTGRSPWPFPYWYRYEPPQPIIGGQMCSWNNEERAEDGLLFDAGPGFADYGRPGPRVQLVAERLWAGDRTSIRDLLERTGAAYW